ncbi:MAG: hypothetical protein AB1599_00900 [Planctomycetota bacterium]
MSIKTKLVVPVATIVIPHPDMSEKRVKHLTDSAETINEHRKYRIRNDADFAQIMATPASDKFRGTVSFPGSTQGDRNADDIYALQRSKMLRAYNKYNDGLDRQFLERDGVYAKLYKDSVTEKQSNWDEEVARGTLRFTGSRARGRQVASVMGYWLTGDQQALQRLPEGSVVIIGKPYDIAIDDLRATLRTSLTQILTQTGIIITESGYDPDMFDRHNTRIKKMLEKLSDPLKAADWVAEITPDKSYCVWFMEDGQLKLETQIYLP